MKIITKYFDRILWIALLIVVLLVLKQCKDEKDRNAELAAAAKALQDKVHKDSIEHQRERKHFENQVIAARAQTAAAIVDVKVIDKKLTASTARIGQLVEKIEQLKGIAPDSSFVLVHPEYVDNCDELAKVSLRQQSEITDARRGIIETANLMNYEIEIRDSAIKREQRYSEKLKADFNSQSIQLKAALQQGKPKGRLLGGLSIAGNEKQLLAGAGVVIAYQTNGGKQYQVSPKFIKVPGQSSAEVYYEGTVLFTLFK